MNAKDKRELETMLVAEGLPGLTDPDLIQAMADLVSNWPGDKHDYMRDLLNECDADKRYEMYQAIAPKLKFKALSFSQYEAQIAMRAGAMVSQGRARVEGTAPRTIEIGGHKLAMVERSEATACVATVKCHRCPKNEHFYAATPVAAMTLARKAGWTREAGVNKEVCPECSEALAATIVRLSDNATLAVYDRRLHKLDA